MRNPIEVQIWTDRIEILSFPGPVPPVDAEVLASQHRIVARDYRNRRIGDFLKELHLTEGRGTGIPKIYGALEKNGSPRPAFETDHNCTYFLSVIYAHPGTTDQDVETIVSDQANDQANVLNISSVENLNQILENHNDQASDQAGDEILQFLEINIHNKVIPILENLLKKPLKRAELLMRIGLKNHTDNRKKYLDPMIEFGWVGMTIPDRPTHQDQKYKITKLGTTLLQVLKRQ